MTIKQALAIASSHVTIVGDEIYMPHDWTNVRGPSTSTPVLSDPRQGTSQQQRAEAIAYGMCCLLENGVDACASCEADLDDRGGQAGALAIYRRATYRQTAHDLQSYTS